MRDKYISEIYKTKRMKGKNPSYSEYFSLLIRGRFTYPTNVSEFLEQTYIGSHLLHELSELHEL